MNTTTTTVQQKKNLNNATSADNDCLIYRPFQSPIGENNNLNIKRDHYSTSLDPRGYIPVYEYIINNTPIMWDRETGYVHFTGIWKALGNSKSDIVKLVDSNPELGTKKIRGGFLRIQGTWIPYDYAHLLCKRTAWHIRKELIPIFGQQFPLEALNPDHPDYGCLLLDPKNMPTNGKVSQHKQRNTMRQNNNLIKPYTKKSATMTKKGARLSTKPMKTHTSNYMKKKLLLQQQREEQERRNHKIASSMSVTRLLNSSQEEVYEEDDDDILSSEEELTDDDDMMTDDNGTSSSSSSSVYSPSSSSSSSSFRVIQTYPSPNEDSWLNQVPLLSPINKNCFASPYWPNTPAQKPTTYLPSSITPTHISQDIIDTISATILLQRLSQDDGARPFKPLSTSVIPNKVIVGHQEFTICWDY